MIFVIIGAIIILILVVNKKLDSKKFITETQPYFAFLKEDDYETIIKNMGNNIMIVSGADMESNRDVITLINNYPNVYGTYRAFS